MLSDGSTLSADTYRHTLTYDARGNRLSLEDNPLITPTYEYHYDDANRLSKVVEASGTTTYTYDANGNPLTIEEPSGHITTNTWNGENRLVQVEHHGGAITTYTYNADGLRVREEHDGVETRFVYDGNNLLRETDDTNLPEADYTYVPQAYAEAISQRRDGDSSFYLADGIKNVRKLTDDAGLVTDEYAFDAFGGARSSTGSTTNSQQYKGQLLGYRRDPHAGPDTDYSTHHRNYNPKTGRFRSEDPAADDLNLYRYVNNDPVNQADPSGLEAGSDIYTGPIEIFEVAKEKWGVPGGVSRQTHNIQLDEYLLVPTFLKDANGQFTILSHYVAVREVAVRVRNGPDGLEMKPRFEWIVPKTRLREFSEKEERFAGAAAVAFGLRFELLESQRRLLMGDATGTIKHQLIEQWTDPANYFTAFATAAHALPRPAPTLAPRGSPLKNQMGDPVKAAGSARSDPVYGWGRNRNVTPKAPKSTVSTTAPAQIVGPKSAIDPQLDNNLLSQLVNPAHPNHAAAVAYAEANKAAGLSVNRAAYKEFLQHFSKEQFSVLREKYGIKLIREISLDELNSVAQRLRKAFDGSGRGIGEGDANVAASALLRGEKLATNDLQFFKRAKDLGLNVEYVGSGNAAANAAKYVPQPVTIP